MKKAAPFFLVLVLAFVFFGIRYFKDGNTSGRSETTKESNDPASINRNRGFDRRVSYLEYTKHARCRMDCRKISETDVEEIMKSGKVNYNKSDLNANPCPTYTLQGYTNDGEHLRVVYAQCDKVTKVVTCINLEEEFKCHCLGD